MFFDDCIISPLYSKLSLQTAHSTVIRMGKCIDLIITRFSSDEMEQRDKDSVHLAYSNS